MIQLYQKVKYLASQGTLAEDRIGTTVDFMMMGHYPSSYPFYFVRFTEGDGQWCGESLLRPLE